ncbi:methyltransferase [Candidatus Woesearchaeota archaeon]|nr:methyltransferase [Candidatus Woesearchaeota archaeon]
MKAIIWSIQGLESISQKEIKEITKKESKVLYPGRIIVEDISEKELAELTVEGRSFLRTGEYLNNTTFAKKEEILSIIKNTEFKFKGSFALRCERKGEHEFNSQEIEHEAGDIVGEKTKQKVDLEEPQYTILLDIQDNNCTLMIDWCGKVLSKRDYRIKINNTAINPCFAYCLIRIAEWNPKEALLDPFTKTGEIPIEAALYATEKLVHQESIEKFLFQKFYLYKPVEKIKEKELKITAIDSLQNNLRNAEINARLANIQKQINFRRVEMDWMDIKVEENAIDKIITFPPFPTNQFPEQNAAKLYREFFYQAAYILKPNGKMIIVTPKKESILIQAKQYKFKQTKEVIAKLPGREFSILTLEKTK